MAIPDATLIDAIEKALGPIEAVRLAYLFGSRARGTARPDSDLDLAVAYPRELFRAAAKRVAAEMARRSERLGNAVSMRDVLVHDYVGVDLEMLARTVRDDRPDLEARGAAIGRLL
jgi:predicted nucleotidyltransferase